MPWQKCEILRHVESKEPYWILDNVATTNHPMIKEKVDIMPKFWQISVIIDIVYKKIDIIISTGKKSNKSLSYQLIPLIKKGAIILMVLLTIVFMTNHVYLFVITVYCKL